MTVDATKKRKRRLASDEAHAWARNLRLHNPHGKSVLRAAALYSDDRGVCTVGLPTLAEDCDVSVDTVRSRVRFLEKVGAVVCLPRWRDANGIENTEGRGKRTTDEIRLLIDADPDAIEARALGQEPADDGASDDGFSPSQQQGLNDAAETVSPRPALGQPLDSANHLISEPEPEDSPQPPSGGCEPEHFVYFKANYPDRELWAWDKALAIFAAIDPADQVRAAAASPEYAKKIAATRRKPPPVRPERFLRDRIFANYPDARLPEKPAELAPSVFYPEGSDVFNAVKAAFLIGCAIEFRIQWDGPTRGVWRREQPSPDLLAMAPWHDAALDELPEVAIEGSQEFGAWRARLRKWTGYTPDARKIWVEPHDPAIHDLPFTHPQHRWRKHVLGLRVPWSFPPSATGKLYPAGSDPPLMTEQDLQTEF